MRIFQNLKDLASGQLVRDLRWGRLTREWIVPRHFPPSENEFVPSVVLSEAGLDLRDEKQCELLARWRSSEVHQALWQELRRDPEINTEGAQGFLHNGFYPTPDAEIYASMILDQNPDRIVEVGSGFSTRVARKAVAALEAGALARSGQGSVEVQRGSTPRASVPEIHVIDPMPRTHVQEAAHSVQLKFVEDVEPADIPVAAHSLLFIDSSHICRGRGDIPHLFCRLLPELPSGTRVHVHDIFTPYEYPSSYLERLYTEQYVLQAMLAHNPRYQILMATHYMVRRHVDEMRKTFGNAVGSESRLFGASFWFDVV